jgi:hypothetical protein
MGKTVSMGFVLLALGVAGGAWQVTALSAEAPPDVAVRWEYRVLTKEQLLDQGKKELTAALNSLGDEGWELVTAEPVYIFKRSRGRGQTQVEDLKRRLALAESDVEMQKDRVA